MNTDKMNELLSQKKKLEDKKNKIAAAQNKNAAQIKKVQRQLRKELRVQKNARLIKIGEVLEDYIGTEIDPDIFLMFLHTYGIQINYLHANQHCYTTLADFYKTWIASPNATPRSAINSQPGISSSKCLENLKRLHDLENKLSIAKKEGNQISITALTKEIEEFTVNIGLTPFNKQET